MITADAIVTSLTLLVGEALLFALLGWVIYVQLRREMRATFESELAADRAKQQTSLQFMMAEQDHSWNDEFLALKAQLTLVAERLAAETELNARRDECYDLNDKRLRRNLIRLCEERFSSLHAGGLHGEKNSVGTEKMQAPRSNSVKAAPVTMAGPALYYHGTPTGYPPTPADQPPDDEIPDYLRGAGPIASQENLNDWHAKQ